MPHSYDLGELGRYYGKYRELMEHWEKVLPEGLPDDRRLRGCGRRHREGSEAPDRVPRPAVGRQCVDFHKSDRPVKTASVAQVRKPIYKTSVKRWKKYGDGPAAAGRRDRRQAGQEGKAEAKPKAKAKAKAKRTPDRPIRAGARC